MFGDSPPLQNARFSFELYPPRSAAAEASLFEAVDRLTAVQPDFVSVTYRPTGHDRAASLGVLDRLIRAHKVSAMAHLTCVGSSFEETSRVIREFLDAGVTSFLALRGDPPEGSPDGDDFLGDFRSAGELVQLIHRVQAERSPFSFHEVPGFPAAKRLRSGTKVTIAVATFPNGHPRSRSRAQDIDTLLAKEAAGANLAITQLFFHAEEYFSFVDEARDAGVTMRIVPGIMPVLSVARLNRMLELSGEATPRELLASLESAPDAATASQLGIEACIRLARDLLAGGADGIHLYTFNRAEAPLAVLRGAGLLEVSNLRS
ncbi:MAG: methylenetetrahydrofolate reductase [Salinibacterium sp.]|nr:methylenetetrahydrofolate reductase [Salinibacterium sp.]